MHEVYEPTDGSKNRTDEVCKKLCHWNIDSEHICTLLVSTHCIEIAPKLCPSEDKEKNYNHENCNKYPRFYICRNVFSNFINRTHSRNIDACFNKLYESFVLNIELCCIYNGCHTFCKEHARKGNDEWLNVKECNKESKHLSKTVENSVLLMNKQLIRLYQNLHFLPKKPQIICKNTGNGGRVHSHLCGYGCTTCLPVIPHYLL